MLSYQIAWKRALLFALAIFALVSMRSSAQADIKDYEFRLIKNQLKAGATTVAVRLVHKPDGKPVTDAVVFTRRLDMAPEGMETMTTSIEPEPSTEPGVYRFRVDLTMKGSWRLSLAAKIQGETSTLQNRLPFKAQP